MRLAEVFTRNSTLVMRVTDVWHARYWCFVTPGIDVTPVLVFVALAINELSIYIYYIYTVWSLRGVLPHGHHDFTQHATHISKNR